jgi:hypothetical protein
MRRTYKKFHSYLNLVCLLGLFAVVDSHWDALYSIIKPEVQAFFTVACGQIVPWPVCGSSTTLSVDPGDANYKWSTGETTPTITVTTAGTYTWDIIDMTNNKVVNGYFTNGNKGFMSAYVYQDSSGGITTSNPYGPLSAEKTYTVTTNPNFVHTNFKSFLDHTANTVGKRNMMVINGASTTGVKVWEENIPVAPNTDYIFSIWMTSVHPDNPGILAFSINNSEVGSPINLTNLSNGAPDWKNFTVRWSSGSNTTADIAIVNNNTASSGNDFAIDDVVFAPICTKGYKVTFSNIPNQPTITPR